jgi:YhcH/YjgK/YiaL family protein
VKNDCNYQNLVGDLSMINDSLKNMSWYCGEGSKLYRALKYAMEFELSQQDGEYEVEGRDIVAVVQTYSTQVPEQRAFETHRKYYDVQVMKIGSERHDVYLGFEADLQPLTEYDTEKDVIKLEIPSVFRSITISPDDFTVYYPQDIHRSNCCINLPAKVRKICMRVKI